MVMSACVEPAEGDQVINEPSPSASEEAQTKRADEDRQNEWAARAYASLASKSTADLEEIRKELKKTAVFAGIEVASAVDIISVETGEVFAHELKLQRNGQDAGYAMIAVVDDQVRVHSHTMDGGTLVRDLLATLASKNTDEPSLNIEVYQYEDFDYLVQDLDNDVIASTDRFEKIDQEEWPERKAAYATRGEPQLLNPREWSNYGPGDHGDPAGGLDPDKVDPCENAKVKNYYHIAGGTDTPLWDQFKTRHYGGLCSVGCGPVAYAMYLAWAQKVWSGVDVFPGDAFSQAPQDNNVVGNIVKKIGDHLDTFCIKGMGATAYYPRKRKFRKRVNAMLDDVNRHGGRDLESFVDYYSDKSKALHGLLTELKDKDRPVVLFGWGPDHDLGSGIVDRIAEQHIYLVDGYTEWVATPSYCGSEVGALYRINLGWGPGISKKTQKSVSRMWIGKYRIQNRIKALGRIRKYDK